MPFSSDPKLHHTNSAQRDSKFDGGPIARVIARVLQFRERDLPALLVGTELAPSVLYDGSGEVMSEAHLSRVVENAMVLTTDESFGLRCGLQIGPAQLGPAGLLVSNAPNLGSAVRVLTGFRDAGVPFVSMTTGLLEDGRVYGKYDVNRFVEGDAKRVVLEAFSVATQMVVETYLQRPVVEAVFEFEFEAPGHAAQFSEFLHGEVRFSQPETRFLIPQELVGTRLPGLNSESYAHAYALFVELIGELPGSTSDIVDRVSRLLLTHSLGSITQQDAANALYISKRTLARRLAERGMTYGELKDHMLAHLATRYLADGSVSVDTIASLLGYHDSTNFRRAFRRWFGVNPAEYRQQIGESE